MNSHQSPTSAEQQRVVRIFVSSTFRDMHAEREELVKFIFPELRKLCRERYVDFVDIDLRWGINDEQKAEGKVLPICLSEIERCRPYFIGLLGERYGWVPDEIDDELINDQPWLKEHKEKSVTELEIIHGVLKNPEMKKLSFFYFRDSERSKQVEEEMNKKLGYSPEPEESQIKLKSLKDEIRKSGYPIIEDYPDAKKLGQSVLENLWKVIKERFPEEEIPSALERDRMEHEAFQGARTKVYIGREEYFSSLDTHIKSSGPPLVVLGESGSGKSTLIANWVARYRKDNPDDFIITHFIGSTPDSADYVSMLRRIMQEIKDKYEPESKEGIEEKSVSFMSPSRKEDEVPVEPEEVVKAFPVWLAKAAAKGRVILVLDALNQLEDRDRALELGWLPEYFFPRVRVVLSTLPGPSLKVLKKRNLQTLTVQPIDKEDRQAFIPEYLKQYRKALNKDQIIRVASAEQASNPLYLRTLLEELRVFGIHEELDNRISNYLKANTVDALFELVLDRLEKDYERDRAGLVSDVMTLLWASRRGLSEAELLALLDVPSAIWSPLSLALQGHLISRSGLLNFFHDFLRKAVEDKYLRNAEEKRISHLRLADYFVAQELDDRKVDELPWQLKRAESWERLKNCIADLEIFLRLRTDVKQYELMGYWLAIGKWFDMVEVYTASIKEYEKSSDHTDNSLSYRLNETALFLSLNARYEDAEKLYRRVIGINDKLFGPEHINSARCKNNLAQLLRSRGDYEGAEPLFRRTLEINEKVLGKEHPDTGGSINNLAGLLSNRGDYEGAEPLFQRAIEIFEKVFGREHSDTAASINNLAGLLYRKGDYDGAEPLYRRALEISEKVLGREHPDTAVSINNLANLFQSKGNSEEAEPLFRRALEINEKVFGREHPATAGSIDNLALLLINKGNYEEAEPLIRRALEIREKVLGKEHPDTAISINNLAGLFRSKGDYEEAEPLFRRALEIKEKTLGKEHPSTVVSKKNFNELIISKWINESDPLNQRALGEEHSDTGISKINFVELIKNKSANKENESVNLMALEIYENMFGKEHPNTATSANNLAESLRSKGDCDGAEPLYRRALEIREKVLGRDHPDTAQSTHNLAELLRQKGDYEEAEPLYLRAHEIYEKVYGKEHPDTATNINNLAVLLYSKGDYTGAEPLFRIALDIYEKILGREHPVTQNTTNNLDTLLKQK